MKLEDIDTYRCFKTPPILTAIIGAMCKDGIALIADTKLTHGIDRRHRHKIDEKISYDLEHFLVGYAGTRQTFKIFRQYIVGNLVLGQITRTDSFPDNISRASHCISKLNQIAKPSDTIELLAVNHRFKNSQLYHIDEFGKVYRESYYSIGSGQEEADDFCKSLPHKQISMSDFAKQAVRAIRFMEQNRRGLGVGGPITIRYMGYDSEWDAKPSDDEVNDFEESARKYSDDFNGRKKAMIEKSINELTPAG
jgi:20S proteasome alpha/beta subunit